jgi:DNA-binding CsgD family transcriptional regulator
MNSSPARPVAVIGDLVGSRAQADRKALQHTLLDVLAAVNETEASSQELAPTIGDEFQAVYPDLGTALRATLQLRLRMPDGLDCRFGLGAGDVRVVGRSDYGLTQDGSAWWSAREAIDEAKRRETGKNKSLRSWFVRADEAGPDAALVNAHLLLRDEIVSAMTGRGRRLALGHLLGVTQKELAAQEGITQGAVSQHLRSSGAMSVVSAVELVGAAS